MTVCVRVCAAVAAVVLSNVMVVAQATPNLAGTWVIDRDKTAALAPAAPAGGGGASGMRAGGSAGGMVAAGGGAPAEIVITQTAAAITIVRGLPDGSQQKYVYKLDGSESVNVNGRTTQTTKSTVASGKITTVGTQSVSTDQGAVTGEFREVRWLDKGGAMIVETTRTANGSARTTTQAFTKK